MFKLLRIRQNINESWGKSSSVVFQTFNFSRFPLAMIDDLSADSSCSALMSLHLILMVFKLSSLDLTPLFISIGCAALRFEKTAERKSVLSFANVNFNAHFIKFYYGNKTIKRCVT